MKKGIFEVRENSRIAENTYRMVLKGDTSAVATPGQFVNIELTGFFLRRPISVCDKEGDLLTLIYKAVGKGTGYMSGLGPGAELDLLTGLGNGYDTSVCGDRPAVIGGGAGVPPMYWLAKRLISEGKSVTAILGFNTEAEVFYADEFARLGASVYITTLDGSVGTKGFVTDALAGLDCTYTFACGPEPMLKAVYDASDADGQFSFEERMGCGFGACVGCTCRTKYGYKRICRDGPVLYKGEIVW